MLFSLELCDCISTIYVSVMCRRRKPSSGGKASAILFYRLVHRIEFNPICSFFRLGGANFFLGSLINGLDGLKIGLFHW